MKYMRFSQTEKMEIIQIVQDSELGVNRTLKELGIHKSTFYQWYGKNEMGLDKNMAYNMSYVRTKIQGGYAKTYDPLNEQDGKYFKLSSNSTWMFTKDFFIRLHIQGIFGPTYYDNKLFYNDYLLSCLVSREYKPGSFLYLAYNEGRFDESNPTVSRYFEFNNHTIIL